MKRVMAGTVVSDKMDKTIVVEVERLTRHSIYNRTIRRKGKFRVHDGKNESHVGDKVEIVESRPLSKSKRWRLLQIVEKAVGE